MTDRRSHVSKNPVPGTPSLSRFAAQLVISAGLGAMLAAAPALAQTPPAARAAGSR